MTEHQRPRHRPEASYARGGETRGRIIDAAIILFGEKGYGGVSTRDIAALASVNAPALHYYFDGKEGLYRACVDHIAETTMEFFRPTLEQAQVALDSGADRPALLAALGAIQDAMADYLLASDDAQKRRLFMAHEQVGNGPNTMFADLQNGVRSGEHSVGAALLARLTGRAPDDPLTLIRLMTLHGQLIIFHAARRSVLSILGWGSIDEARVVLLKDIVRQQTRALIDGWAIEETPATATLGPAHAF